MTTSAAALRLWGLLLPANWSCTAHFRDTGSRGSSQERPLKREATHPTSLVSPGDCSEQTSAQSKGGRLGSGTTVSGKVAFRLSFTIFGFSSKGNGERKRTGWRGSELKNKSTFNRGVECGHMRGRGLMGDPSSTFTPGVPADQSGLTRVGVGQGPRGPGQASVSPSGED